VEDLEGQSRVVIARTYEIHEQMSVLEAHDGTNPAQLLAAYGWWSRIIRTARAIGLLYDSGHGHEASPLIRALLHHSVALAWLVEEPEEALPALVWEHQHEGRRMLGKALQRAWDLDPSLGPALPIESAPVGYAYLKSTEQLCDRVGMSNAFVAFLAESKFTHPTAISADAYLGDGGSGVVLLRDPGPLVPLRGTALFASESTIRFATLAQLTEIADEAANLRDSVSAPQAPGVAD
jgi:hypothetical protein